MNPDPLTSSRQGTGNKRARKTGQTVSADDIPPEHRALEGVDEGITEGASSSRTEPSVRHPNRPDREKEGGSYGGPFKGPYRTR
jgi:hypothetical protein